MSANESFDTPITTISISDDSSDDDSTSTSTSESTLKTRNIAVKRGMPVSRPQLPQSRDKPMPRKDAMSLLQGSTFLQDFNPQNSRREKNKRYNFSKPKAAAKKGTPSMYDETGKIRATQEDVCDCFESDCPGCHFPCESCASQKCGQRCRNNRKWAYELIEYDGKNFTKTNPLIQTINNR